MSDEPDPLTASIAGHVRRLREARGHSLDALAVKSGVSRSMISLIERGESSPTAVVLDKLARAFDVTLASLFTLSPTETEPPAAPVSRRAARTPWRDPASGYVRCNISPPGIPQPMQITEVRFPPGARVSFERGSPELRIFQQVWVLDGTIEITVGRECHRLQEGDCLAMQLDQPTMVHNPTRKTTRYAVVVASEVIAKR